MNKKYRDLKSKQKEKIAIWLYEAHKDFYLRKGDFPSDLDIKEIIDVVYQKILDAKINIPYCEIAKRYRHKRKHLNSLIKKDNNQRTEKVVLMNMCMIENQQGEVVALDKVNGNYTGTTFPGGHIERQETFYQAMIREVKEETGLTVKNLKLVGIYHWYARDIHNIIYLYQTSDFSGQLVSSVEGKVYWVTLKELKNKELAKGMELVLQMYITNIFQECFVELKKDGYQGNLY